MKWVPELQPRAEASSREVLEWLVRTFRTLSNWSLSDQLRQDNALEAHIDGTVGYGGISRLTPIVWVGGLSTSWMVIGGYAYDTVLSSAPKGVTQDATNGRLTITEAGLWQLSVTLTAQIVSVTSDAANTILLTLYNITDAVVGDQPSAFVVPRYGEDINFALSVPVAITAAEVGKEFGLAISIKYPTPAITVTDLVAIDLHVTKIAGADAL